MSAAVLELDGVAKSFSTPGGASVTALAGVSFDIAGGERVGLVGGSGSGKSTLARVIAGLEHPDRGRVVLEGHDLTALGRRAQRRARRHLHLVFQDPYGALPPNLDVESIVSEPLVIHGIGTRDERQRRAYAALADVVLVPPERYARRRPSELSGGERQRVALARAVVLTPQLVIADEPTAMLDASLRTELLTLLTDLGAKHGVSYLFITHDLALAGRFCDRLVVLHEGHVVEQGPTGLVLTAPSHPYTAALVDAARARRARRPTPEGVRCES